MRVALECGESGTFMELPVGDWSSDATEAELAILERAQPAVIDIGCGPGRVAHALSSRGVPAMGIDVSPSAVLRACHLGATVIERSVFDPLPGEGRWATAILFDGNIGIGGDPVALLARVAEVVAPGGRVLVEVGVAGSATDVRQVRVRVEGEPPGSWFCWARVAADDIAGIGARVGLELLELESTEDRCFAWLRIPQRVVPPGGVPPGRAAVEDRELPDPRPVTAGAPPATVGVTTVALGQP